MKNTILTGTIGMTSLEIVNNTDLSAVATDPDVIKLVLQLIIGLITLIKLRPKQEKETKK